MRGSVVLLGGAPGIGKSTLLLQLAHELTQNGSSSQGDGSPVLPPTAVCAYISGEESAHQIKARAGRLGNAEREGVMVMNETNLDTVLQSLQDLTQVSPLPLGAVIIDSIQTMFLTDLSAAAGSIVQVRECALRLMQFAKSSNVPVILTGHVTKSGELAGPRVLEHMVDAVLYIEGEPSHTQRLMRTAKNRFGSTAEVAVFEMADDGLREVPDSEGLFLSGGAGLDALPSPGSVVMATLEGSRPVPVEVQALVSPTTFEFPRHRATGIPLDRLHMILAVLQRHTRTGLRKMDVHVNVVGGLRVSDPAADLAIALAIISSATDTPVPRTAAVIGELGLSGEVRPVTALELRANALARVGVKTLLGPRSSKSTYKGELATQLDPVKHISHAAAWLAAQSTGPPPER